jgi:fatty-acyl-CoA synthase
VPVYTASQQLDYRNAEQVYKTRRLSESLWPGKDLDQHEFLYLTVPDWLRKNAAEVPDRLALVEGIADAGQRRTWTYARLLEDAERIAAGLLERFEPGARVAIMAPNVVEYALLQYGLSIAGMTMVTLNPAYHKREVEHVLKTAEVSGVFVLTEWRGNKMRDTIDELRAQLPMLREVFDIEELDRFMGSASGCVTFPDVTLDDPAVIMFTSGTTGLSKGAILNHMGMTNSTRFMALRAGLPEGGVWIGVMPMQHMGGNGFSVLGTLQQQGTLVLAREFDVRLFYELVEAYQGNYALLVPTMVEAFLDYPDRGQFDISSLGYIQSGASVVPAALVRRVESEIGCQMSVVCGQTESHGGYSQTHLDDSPQDQSETIGQPYPKIDFKIGDQHTSAVLALGEEGEICVRGYQVMVGYVNDPVATASAIDADGWLHTGDLGTMDERGFVRFVGRLKDMIVRGGVNIYSAEIEGLLAENPKVGKVAVVGVPDQHWGQQAAAIILPKRFDDLPAIQDLDTLCLDTIARFKRPRFYAFVSEFPFTSAGKLRKFQLQEDIANGKLELHPVQLR